MEDFFKTLLRLPYSSGREFERAVGDVIKDHGLYADKEPNGSQNAPDWRIIKDGVTINLECKSAKDTAKPTYNGGLPHKNMVYVFCAKKHDSTTLFFGDDVVGDVKRNLYNSLLLEQNKILIKYQEKEEWKDSSRGFDFYNRSMYIQQKIGHGNPELDYFKHNHRDVCEQNVINHEYSKKFRSILHKSNNS